MTSLMALSQKLQISASKIQITTRRAPAYGQFVVDILISNHQIIKKKSCDDVSVDEHRFTQLHSGEAIELAEGSV